ncbi:MAG: hypothetical protein RR088_04270 [Clostridia bacterium]
METMHIIKYKEKQKKDVQIMELNKMSKQELLTLRARYYQTPVRKSATKKDLVHDIGMAMENEARVDDMNRRLRGLR